MEILSTSPALMNCCPISAPPITATAFSPTTVFACSRALSIPGHEGVDAALGYLLRLGVGDDEYRNPGGTYRAVRSPPRNREIVGASARDHRRPPHPKAILCLFSKALLSRYPLLGLACNVEADHLGSLVVEQQ